jgi:hypothetical protein
MKRIYSIPYLLSKQPKAIKKNKYYQMLITFYNASPFLKKTRINRKCFALLNNSKISPENLKYFYRTYRLPENPFFPIFLIIKREYIKNKIHQKKLKGDYIKNNFLNLDKTTLRFIKYFAKFESTINNHQKFPVWNKTFYPTSKKSSDNLLKLDRNHWIKFFEQYIERLKNKYIKINEKYANKIIALFILDLPIEKHSPAMIKKQYRKLSLKYHPDHGGNSDDFNLLQKARSILMDEN